MNANMNIFSNLVQQTTQATVVQPESAWSQPEMVEHMVQQLGKQIPLIEWESFSGGGIDVVRRWSGEILNAMKAHTQPAVAAAGSGIWSKFIAQPMQGTDTELLALAGDRLLIQCEDTEKALLAARKAAAEIGAGFMTLTEQTLEQSNEEFHAMLVAVFNYQHPLLLHIPTFGLLQFHLGLAKAADEQQKQLMEQGLPAELTSPKVPEEMREARLLEFLAKQAPAFLELKRLRERASILAHFILQNRTRNDAAPLVVVMATPSSDGGKLFSPLDDELREKEIINREFNLPRRSLETIGQEFIEKLGQENCHENLLRFPAKVGRIVLMERWHNDSSNLRFRRHLHRLAHNAGRKIMFEDIINITLRGTMEADELPMQSRIKEATAYHEAGHALSAIIGSNGAKIPEYATAVPGTMPNGLAYLGVVSGSIESQEVTFQDFSYADLRWEIQHALAGRAAEELIYGSENVSTGARNDLEQATLQSIEKFGLYGLSPGMHKPEASGKNLAINFGLKGNDLLSSNGQLDRLYDLTRQFLAEEYQVTLEMLKTHRPFLEMIVDAMIGSPIRDEKGNLLLDNEGACQRGQGDSVLDKTELERLYRNYLESLGK